MPTVEERLAAYRDVLDVAVEEPPANEDVKASSLHRDRHVVGSLLPVAAVALVLVGGIVFLARPESSPAPIASVPSTSPVNPFPDATTVPVTTAPSTPVPVDPAIALGPITFDWGSRTLSDAEQRARNALMIACMAAAGFPYEPELIGVSMMSPAEHEVAAVRAWRAASEANAARPGYRAAEEGPDGCLGQAFDRMYPVPEQRSAVLLSALRAEASGDIRDRLFADEEYLADLAQLGSCLVGQGYEVDTSLADPERTTEQILDIFSSIVSADESVDPEEYEFVSDWRAATDAPANAVCSMFSDVMRTSFNAADRRAGEQWLAEHSERLEPIREVMVTEYQRFLAVVDTAPLVVELHGQLIEVSVTANGAGLCGRFVPGGEGGCDGLDPTDPSAFVWVSPSDDTRLVLYGFMPSGWDAWLEVDGVRTEVSLSRPGGADRVAIAASLPPRTEAGVVEMVQVDEDGSVVRTTIER